MTMHSLSKAKLVLSWICRATAAVILLQTLFFKFTGAEESVYIFTKLGMEPAGRYASGVVELIAAVLLLFQCHAWLGALLATGVMSGAIVSHLTVLGISVENDGGLLFCLAIVVLLCSLVVLLLHWRQIPIVSRLDHSRL
jgi:uncharacterized membrane protein YphA (DoxX/SURF4 family)